MKPLVSICVPVRNSGKVFEQTIKSLVVQTYRPLEIVVNDNASAGFDRLILHQVLQTNYDGQLTIRSHRLPFPVNMNESFRYAWQMAKGEFLHMHSSTDPQLAPDWVEKMVQPMLDDDSIDFTVCEERATFDPAVPVGRKRVMVDWYKMASEFVRYLVRVKDKRERAKLILEHSVVENMTGTCYALVCRRRCLPTDHWRLLASSYFPETFVDWDFAVRLLLNHTGKFVEGVFYQSHMAADHGSFRRTTDPEVYLVDSVYRMMMPVVTLVDPDFAVLDEVIDDDYLSDLLMCVMSRLVLANKARGVHRDAKATAASHVVAGA